MSTSTPLPAVVQLGPHDAVAERPFTDPRHSRADAACLNYMRWRLHYLLSQSNIGPEHPLARELYIQMMQETNQRYHRIVILERGPLLTNAELTFVGFFGQRRFESSPAMLQEIDTELIQEFLHHTYVLAYCSLELADNNWANLVLLRSAEGIQHWRASQRHAYAARELAPLYYMGIRLHNGVLPEGLDSPYLRLTRTKYYDFQGPGLWQAIRDEVHTL
jgi:hypothetical protein